MAKAFFVLMYLFVALFVLAMVPYEGAWAGRCCRRRWCG